MECHGRVSRKGGSQGLCDADRSHARSAAPVRDAERLVQVEVTDIGADIRRPADADLGVEVRAIHIDLATRLVHDPADLADRRFKDAMRRRVGHYHRGERVAILRSLGTQLG